jgi:hypothetical protein
MQDRKGSDSGYLVPWTWYLEPVPHSHTSNLNKAIPRVRVFRSMRRAFRLVPGTGYQVSGTWHLGPGTRYRINAEGRTPSTEDRARHRKTRTRGMHPVSCIHSLTKHYHDFYVSMGLPSPELCGRASL